MDKNFLTGCNYWASNAGVNMWRDFDPAVIDKDFKLIKEYGMDTLRVFPLWSDFQPLIPIFTQNGVLYENRLIEEIPLGSSDYIEAAGLSREMLSRFALMLDTAAKYGIKVIVGLITGWMSGRLFIPAPLYNRNILTDPYAISMQVRFVSAFVRYFKDSSAILAWDLGNEANCMAEVKDGAEAYLWTAAVSGAIKREDSTRPLVSGMHSLDANPRGKWTIGAQGELTDVLCTHPYDYWVPYCIMDSLHSFRAVMHSAAESRLYEALGGKPCLVEEIGTMGPMIAGDKTSADFMRATLFHNFVNGFPGQLWWCAFDQEKLNFSPYDTLGCERELGLFTSDGMAKPMTEEVRKFSEEIKKLKVKLPPPDRKALVILTEGQDTWAAALGSYLVLKQSGIDADFAFQSGEYKDYPLYVLPSIKGNRVIMKHKYQELLNKVKAGATLYISIDDAFIQPFTEVTGLNILDYASSECGNLPGSSGGPSFSGPLKYSVTPISAVPLMQDKEGHDILYVNNYGKGKVITLLRPLETYYAITPYSESMKAVDAAAIAEIIKRGAGITEIFKKPHPLIAKTEHTLDGNTAYISLINCSCGALDVPISLNGWEIKKLHKGTNKNGALRLMPFDAALIEVTEVDNTY